MDKINTNLPKAFAVAQDTPLVKEPAFNAAYNANYPQIYGNVADETLNLTGQQQVVAKVQVEVPGFNYTLPPIINLNGGGLNGGTPGLAGTPGIRATAAATLNGVTGITLINSGSGYTTAPAVSITPGTNPVTSLPDTGTGALAQAVVSGGVVTAVVITEPGSNYMVAPQITIAAPPAPGVAATATAQVTLGSVGSITVINAGQGYFKAPYVTVANAPGSRGIGAIVVARITNDTVMDGKLIVEGMDMEYGRMNAQLGSIPNPLTPLVGAGAVVGPAMYIDPPTEIVNPDTTYLWRLMHIGVDSHSLHFHLFKSKWSIASTGPTPPSILIRKRSAGKKPSAQIPSRISLWRCGPRRTS